MPRTVEIPPLEIKIFNQFLGLKKKGFTAGYLISLCAVPNHLLTATVYTEDGALFSRLPLNALLCEKYSPCSPSLSSLKSEDVQPFSCLEGSVELVSYPMLQDSKAKLRTPHMKDKIENAHHLGLSIDYIASTGLSSTPDQHKTHNLLVSTSGYLLAFPNNFLLFQEPWFAISGEWPKYRRSNKYHFPGS